MSWYFVENQEQQGPLDEAAFSLMIQEGRIHDQTYVWRDGLESWKYFSEIKSQFNFSTGAVTGGCVVGEQVSCIACEQKLNSSDCLSLSGNRWVCAACKPKVVQQMKEGVAIEGSTIYGGFWVRVGAKILDALIQMAVTIPFGLLIPKVFAHSSSGKLDSDFMIAQGISMLFSLGVAASYSIFLIGKYQATLGKMVLGLKVVRSDGAALTYGRACGRYFAEILSSLTLLIGFIMVAFDREKRSLHDRVADTRVIVKKK